MSFPLSLLYQYTFLIIMSYSSISTRADSMADEGYSIVKIMNYAEDDFPELIAKVNALEQIDVKEMEQEEEEEEELSLSARAWGCWMSDSLWVGPPVSRAP
jgi:hypothetical protein